MRAQLEAAGFKYVGESKVLANPEDDHSWMVFAPGKRGRAQAKDGAEHEGALPPLVDA